MRIGTDGSWRQVPPGNSSTNSVESGQGAQQTSQTEETGHSSSSSFWGSLCSRCSKGLSRVRAVISSMFSSLVNSIRSLSQYITRDKTGTGDSSGGLAPRVSTHGAGFYQDGSASHSTSNLRDNGPPDYSPPPPPVNKGDGESGTEQIYDTPRVGGWSTSSSSHSHVKTDYEPIYDTPRVFGTPIPMPQSGGGLSQDPVYDTPRKLGESSSSVGSSSSSSSS